MNQGRQDDMPTHAELNRPSALAAQFLPPFLCLWPLLSRNDAMLYLGALASVAVILASLTSLIVRMSRPKERRGRLLRATLAIGLSGVALLHFHSERQLALLRIDSLAAGLQTHCRQYGSCPSKIEGWTPAAAPFASMLDDTRGRIAHRYLYAGGRDAFELRLDIGFGFSERASGGRNQKLQRTGRLPRIEKPPAY